MLLIGPSTFLGLFLNLACVPGLPASEEGLVGHWRFDQTGPQLADLSGHGHTARVSGGKILQEAGANVLALNGEQHLIVPSSGELNLSRHFTIEARLRLDRLGDGHTLVFKDNQYSLRVDWAKEGKKISFFVFADQKWEPRVSSVAPEPGRWYHLVATWNGREAALWVNGEPFQTSRWGALPPANDSPLVIASRGGHGPGIQGAIDYVKIYHRTLSTAEIIGRAYGIQLDPQRPGRRLPVFDFAQAPDLQGWSADPGTEVALSGGQMVLSSPSGRGVVLHKNLHIDIGKRDFLSLRLATDTGSRGELVFVTTQGAGRIPFPTQADNQPHAYVLEPWTWPGWGGTLLALVLVPSEVPGGKARIAYLRLNEEPQAEPEVRISQVFSESVLPRAGRREIIKARIQNLAGPARNLLAELNVPPGVILQGSSTQPIGKLDFLEEKEVAWIIQVDRPGSFDFRVTVPGTVPTTTSQRLSFSAAQSPNKAAYVPRPVPLPTGKYTLWTHYCPLWKEGTHTGWKAIEPWPERKPVLGWYNEGQPEVADWHIKMMREHGISGVIYCWYRTNKNAPVKQALGHALHDGLLKAKYLPMIGFGIMWENGCGQGCGSADDLLNHLLPFWIENYFSHPSYLKIHGQPVLYIWVPANVTRDLGGSDIVRRTFERMRNLSRARPGRSLSGGLRRLSRPSDPPDHGPRRLGCQQRVRQRLASTRPGALLGELHRGPLRGLCGPARRPLAL